MRPTQLLRRAGRRDTRSPSVPALARAGVAAARKLRAPRPDARQPAVVVEDVESHDSRAAANLESPAPGAIEPGFAIALSGWVFTADAAVESIEIRDGGRLHARVPVDANRPDLVEAFPDDPNAANSGFRAVIGALDLPRRFGFVMDAVLADGSRLSLWTVRGRREPVLGAQRHGIRPIVVNTLGRTGSTFLMRLLEQHPQVVVYRAFEYEPRVLSSWIETLSALGDPRARVGALRPTHSVRPWWLGPDRPPTPLPPADETIWSALTCEDVRALATFARERIDAFYVALATHTAKQPVAFAEKSMATVARSGPISRLTHELYDDAREIFLVRDPRDMLCSMLAYDVRRGRTGFGPEGHDPVELAKGMSDTLVHMTRAHEASEGRSLLVRYEDLIADPQATARRIFIHAGLDAARDVVETVLERASQEHPGMAFHRTAGAKASESVGRWRRDLDPKLRQDVEIAVAETLKLHGYEEC